MRKTLIAAALFAAIVFATGYLIGQIRGATPSSAASPAANTPPTQPWQEGNGTHPGGANFGPHADGTVTAVNGDTITVKADSDQGQTGENAAVTTIVLSSSTTYDSNADQGTSRTTAGKADIKVGSYLIASGTVRSDGKTLDATRAMVLPAGHTGNGPPPGDTTPDTGTFPGTSTNNFPGNWSQGNA